MPDAFLSAVVEMNDIAEANRNFNTLRFKIVKGSFDLRVSISGLSVPFEKLQITVV